MSRVLVTGGHGFLGKHVVAALMRAGHEALPRSRRDGLNLLEAQSIRDVLSREKPDAIIHCAAHVGSVHYVARHAGSVFHDNAMMALNLYAAVTELLPGARIINPLSNCSYPGAADVQIEGQWFDGPVHDSVMSYGNAKRFIHVLAACHQKQSGVRSVSFLVPNAFGPGDYTDPDKTHALNGMIIRMIGAQQRSEREFEVWGTGKPVREWGYIKDIAAILVAGLNIQTQPGQPINVAQNAGHAVGDSARLIAEAVGFEGSLKFNTSFQDGAMRKVLDDRVFRSLFPDFKFTDHRQGIRETVAYYRSIL